MIHTENSFVNVVNSVPVTLSKYLAVHCHVSKLAAITVTTCRDVIHHVQEIVVHLFSNSSGLIFYIFHSVTHTPV